MFICCENIVMHAHEGIEHFTTSRFAKIAANLRFLEEGLVMKKRAALSYIIHFCSSKRAYSFSASGTNLSLP